MSQDAQRLNSILAALPHGVQENDLDGVITYSNLAHHKILGYEPDELVGMKIFDLVPDPKDKKKFKDYLSYLVAEQPTPTPYITENRRKNGSTLIVQVNCAYQFNDQNELIGFVSIISDITKQKNTAEEEKIFSERLRQSQKMEALGQLTGGIAHDFNNILASILGYADLTLDAVTTMGKSDLARYLTEVIDSGEKARDLIAQMLAFARAEPTEATLLSPAPLLKETLKLMQSSIPSSIELTSTIDNEMPKINIDPSQLHQIILNLCINARDAIDGVGSIQVNLDCNTSTELTCTSCKNSFSGDFVEISITDNGCGIEPTMLDKIFNPYFTSKESSSNTGMGLSVVHGIVHEHNGHITVESQPGYGTTMRLYFPVTTLSQANAKDTPIKQMPDFEGIEANVLIVDDEESIARLQGELLNNKGLATDVYSDPIKALEAFTAYPNHYDLMIIDQTMPSLTGIEFSKQALKIKTDIPIILCTGQGKEDHEKAAKEIGIKGYLTKPIPKLELFCLIEKLLREK